MAEKETKAQRVERIKREKNPWDLMPDIVRWSQEGFDSIPQEDMDVRLRAWGIYTQGDGRGVQGKAVPYFMMRIALPGGDVRAHQLRTIAELTRRYARGVADITDRQNIQLHWLRIEDIPSVMYELNRVGLSNIGACGDNPRNITGCPLAGIDHEELIDAGPLVTEITRELKGNKLFSNLPRKFKITVSGCKDWCNYPEINDVAFQAVRAADGHVGFHVRVGGGLSTRPFLAVKLNAFIEPHQVPRVARTIAEIFRDSDVLRENRAKARLKFLFIDQGWDADRFLAEIERRLGHALPPAVAEEVPVNPYRDHVGIHAQKQAGLHYVGFSIPTGRVSDDHLFAFADLADRFGQGRLRATTMQNLIVLDIAEQRLAEFQAAAAAALPFVWEEASGFRRGILACTGTEFCKLALVETKQFGRNLADEMERRLPGFGQKLRVNVTGCPNSCGQHWIADVGLMGVRFKDASGAQVDGFEFFIGGGLGEDAAFGRRISFKAAATDVADALERLVRAHDAHRQGEESFRAWANRLADEELSRHLAGVEAVPAEG